MIHYADVVTALVATSHRCVLVFGKFLLDKPAAMFLVSAPPA